MGIMGIYVRTSVETDGTSIEQQKKIGIAFCKKNNFQYQVYEDIGKSGFKIEDDNNPFKNRKGLSKLIDDIENKIVDKVWVYEHSRLSRKEEISFVLNKIFLKNNITIYEKDKQFNINDPQNKMIQGILTQISEYERHLIHNRIMRGVHDSINRGIRGYNSFYGYKKTGKKDDGYMNWVPVKSEIENIKYAYQEFLNGKSVYSIINIVCKKEITEKNRTTLKNKWVRILKHFDNTGYSLNTDGLELFRKYLNFDINSLKELGDSEAFKKYYVKSVHFPIKTVSINDWITVVEKLQDNKKVYKDKMRKTDTEMMTGIIQCPYCELRYYYTNDKNFFYYKHFPKKLCGQLPKSIRVEKMNSLIEVFFFYFYLVYDDTKILIEESQKVLKLNLLEQKDKIRNVETENRRIEKQINRFQNIYEETEDKELLKLTLKKETELTVKLESNNEIIKKLKFGLEELNNKFKEDELELTYYNVKETIINFFEKQTVEQKRASLIKIIKCAQLFNKHLVIDTGKLLFVFNVDENYKLPETIIGEFKKDKFFKENFLNSLFDGDGEYSKDIQEFLNTPKGEKIKKYSEIDLIDIENKILIYYITRCLDDIKIKEYHLKNLQMKISYEKKLENLGIKYDLSGIKKIISFTKL